jgi:hypothetical protein
MPQISRIADPSSRHGHPRTCAPTRQPRSVPQFRIIRAEANGGSGPPSLPFFLFGAKGRSSLARGAAGVVESPARAPEPLRPGASGRGGAGRSRPMSRRTLALASPRRIRDVRGEAAYHWTKPRRAEGSEGADDDPEGQTLAVGRSRPLSSCCWSSPGPPAGSGPPARRPRRRRNTAAMNSPGEWVRRSLRQGRASQERSREQRGAADGRRRSRMGGTE